LYLDKYALVTETTLNINDANVPCILYKPIGARVIKDRNPIGKFKISPKHKGVVTIFMCYNNIMGRNSEYSEDTLVKYRWKALISNLEENKKYSLQILARVGKHNIKINHYWSAIFIEGQIRNNKTVRGDDLSSRIVTKEILIDRNTFLFLWDDIINVIVKNYVNFSKLSIYRSKDRPESVDYFTFIFKPLPLNPMEDVSVCEENISSKNKHDVQKKNTQLESSLKLRTNKRNYSTYKKNIAKRLFSTSSSFYRSQSIIPGGITANSLPLGGKSLGLLEETVKGGEKTTGLEDKLFNQSSVRDALTDDKSIKKTSKIVMENQMFNIIKDILSTSPINHETQLKIEELIFNGFKEFLDDSDNIINILGGFNSKLLSNQDFRAFIHKTIDNIQILLKELKTSISKQISNNKAKKTRDQITLFKIILSNLNIKDLMSIIIMTFFNVITYNMVKKEDKTGDPFFQTNLVNLSLEMGKKIVEFYIRTLYKKAFLDIKLTDFKDKLKADPSHNIIDDVEFLVYIGSGLIQIMKEGGLVEDKIVKIDTKKNQSLITVTEEVLKICGKDLVNKAIAIPFNLPMIVEPKDYINIKRLSDGGYLLNNKEIIQPLFTENLLQTEKSSILKENKLLESINGIMKTPFKINTQLLDYILNIPGFISPDIDPPHSNLKKRTKVQEREYQKWISEKILNDFILTMANTYRHVPEIFFPVMLDFRGRLYSRVSYLNYQGSELAKSLLLFARPGCIERNNKVAIDYLKSYGAVCYGDGLDKKSYIKRIQWVDKHWEDITGLNNDFILTADNKYGFLSFCLEMKRFDDFYNTELTKTFNTYLPIQLDATCNGFQHLALLSDEVNLFSNLNMSEANKDDDPKDFYTFILNKIKAHLQTLLLNSDKGKDAERITRLLQLDLKRSNLKPLVMTKPYNASNYSLTNYLANSLVYRGYGELETDDNNTIFKLVKEGKQAKIKLVDDVDRSSDSTYEDYTEFYKYVKDMENKKKLSSNKNLKDCNHTLTKELADPLKGTESPQKEYIYSSSKTSSDFVSRSDLLYYVETFNTLLFQDYPHIKNLMEYLEKTAEILYNLNLPVLWRLPHGLEVCQRYSKEQIKKIRPYFFSSKELSLTLTDKTVINLTKQKNALMPNLVHSLDAASMILLYYSLKKTVSKKNYVNFYSVHDCFGVTADKVELLITLIRNIYIDIYSNNKYIETFDKDVIENIKIHFGGEGKVKYIEDRREIIVDIDKTIKLPEIPTNRLDVKIIKDYYKKLNRASLLIN
jgi:hypothetical protein